MAEKSGNRYCESSKSESHFQNLLFVGWRNDNLATVQNCFQGKRLLNSRQIFIFFFSLKDILMGSCQRGEKLMFFLFLDALWYKLLKLTQNSSQSGQPKWNNLFFLRLHFSCYVTFVILFSLPETAFLTTLHTESISDP